MIPDRIKAVITELKDKLRDTGELEVEDLERLETELSQEATGVPDGSNDEEPEFTIAGEDGGSGDDDDDTWFGGGLL